MPRPGRRRQVPVITGADRSAADQLRSREIRYAVLMGLRLVCLISAVLLWRVWWPLAVVALAGMLALPWMAVLIANDRPPLRPGPVNRLRERHAAALEAPHPVIDPDHRPPSP